MKKIIFVLSIFLTFSIIHAKDVKELYEKCSTCHGDKAEEKALGKSKILATLSEDEIVKALKDYQEGIKDENGLGRIMESQVYSLTPEDIENLAKYISTTFK